MEGVVKITQEDLRQDNNNEGEDNNEEYVDANEKKLLELNKSEDSGMKLDLGDLTILNYHPLDVTKYNTFTLENGQHRSEIMRLTKKQLRQLKWEIEEEQKKTGDKYEEKEDEDEEVDESKPPTEFNNTKDHLDYLDLVARESVQSLFTALFSCPTTRLLTGPILATLPPPAFPSPLPRSKPIPKPAPPTPWQQFAQAKGIQKKKRSSHLFDENTQEWKPRYGYKSAKNAAKEFDWAREDKGETGEDGQSLNPWEEERKEEKENQRKQKEREEKNKRRKEIDIVKKSVRGLGREGVKDKKERNEKEKGKRKYDDLMGGDGNEKKREMRVLERVLDEGGQNQVVNEEKIGRLYNAEQQKQRSEERDDDDGGSGRDNKRRRGNSSGGGSRGGRGGSRGEGGGSRGGGGGSRGGGGGSRGGGGRGRGGGGGRGGGRGRGGGGGRGRGGGGRGKR